VDGGCDDRTIKPDVREEVDIVDPGDAAPVEETTGVACPHLLKILPDESLFCPHGADVEDDAALK